jgi:hypothetical protein
MGILKNPYVKAFLVTVVTLFIVQRVEPIRKLVYGA